MLKSSSEENSNASANQIETNTDGSMEGEISGSQSNFVSLDQVSEGIKEEYKNDPDFQECTGEIVQSCLSQVISKNIRESGDLTLCDDFLTEDARESCRIAQSYELARENKDVSFCEGLPDPQRESCLREVATATAIDSQNIAACDTLTEERDECVLRASERLAYDTVDASWCENINEENREGCLQDVQDQQESIREQEQQQVESESEVVEVLEEDAQEEASENQENLESDEELTP